MIAMRWEREQKYRDIW